MEWQRKTSMRITYKFDPYAHARDTGDPPAFASNVAIFLSEWVTCTTYLLPFGVSLWNTVCVIGVSPGGVTPIVSILTEKST